MPSVTPDAISLFVFATLVLGDFKALLPLNQMYICDCYRCVFVS